MSTPKKPKKPKMARLDERHSLKLQGIQDALNCSHSQAVRTVIDFVDSTALIEHAKKSIKA